MKTLFSALALMALFAPASAFAVTNNGGPASESPGTVKDPSNVAPGDDGTNGTTHQPVMPGTVEPKASSASSGSSSGSSGTAGPYNPTSPTNNSGAIGQ